MQESLKCVREIDRSSLRVCAVSLELSFERGCSNISGFKNVSSAFYAVRRGTENARSWMNFVLCRD